MSRHKEYDGRHAKTYKNTLARARRLKKPRQVPWVCVVRKHDETLAGTHPWFVVWHIDQKTKRELPWKAYPFDGDAHQEATRQNEYIIERTKAGATG